MIVAVAGVNGNCAAIGSAHNLHRIFVGRIGLGQHDDRPRVGPKRCRVPAPVHPLGHPAHLPMPPFGDKLRQTLFGFGDRIRVANAHRRKSCLKGIGADCLFHRANLGASSGSEIEIGIMRRRTEAGNLVGKDRAEGRARFDLGVPVFDDLGAVPIHVRDIVKAG